MPDEFRTPYDPGYIAAIGRAIYIFAIYEWKVVHTIEKLRPGFLNEWRYSNPPMTAGTIARRFEETLSVTSKPKEAVKAFKELAAERNELVHAHVYSEPDGRQQLIYQGKDKTRTWSVGEIDDLSHRFEKSSITVRDLMNGV